MYSQILTSPHVLTRFLVAALVVFAGHGWAAAQNGTWTNTSGGDYNTPGNWAGNTVAQGAGNTADFNTLDISSDVSVALNSPLTIGNMVFGDTNLASGGTWALTTTDLANAILTLDNGGSKPVMTVNPLVPFTTFDDVFIGNSVAGAMGFVKAGDGILTLGPGTANTITGGIDVMGGTLRVQAALPVQAFTLANGTTLDTRSTVGDVTLPAAGNATYRFSGTNAVSIGSISAPGTGATLNTEFTTGSQVSAGGTWSGFNTVNMTGTTAGTPGVLRLSPNNSFGGAPPTGFNGTSFATSTVNMDNVRMLVRTNSFGNTIDIGTLTGTSTAILAGGNAGSAARYSIGGNNTDSTFSGTIDGAGGISINKVGTGKLTLAGTFQGDATNNSLAIVNSAARQGGVIRVTAGTLAITGAASIPGGFGTTLTTIDVLPGAVFDVTGTPGIFSTSVLQKVQGGGTIRGTYNHDEGSIRPGDVGAATAGNEGNLSAGVVPTAGTITFDGNLQLGGGEIVYDMTLDPNSGNDLVQVTGSTALNSGKITPNFFAGIPSSGTYTVLTSTGGFTGSASNITIDFPGRGVDPIAFTSGNNLQFTAQPGGGSANLVWTGATNSIWDVETTPNWDNGGSSDVFFNLDVVTFDETASNKAVNVSTSVAPSGTITINSTSPYTFTGTGAIIGTAGLTKSGSGNLTMQVANTFSGPASISGGGTVDVGNFGGAFGAGTLTLGGTTIVGVNGFGMTNSSMEIATATTNTIQVDGNTGSGNTVTIPTITGSGTLTLTSTVGDKWYALNGAAAFSGTINLTGVDGQTVNTIRLTTTGGGSTFPNAVVNLNDVALANRQGGAAGSTATFAFGELHGDAQSVLRAFTGGGTAINANWEIGALNTNSDFAGTIVDNTATSISHVTKVGTGTLTLTGANTYTGNTTIEAGTLSITNPTLSLADNADVLITTGAIFDLNFSGTDTIRSLYLDGVSQAVGTWGSLASLATNKRAFFTGNGILDVTTFVPFVLAGDYNNNGVVDAADYVVWRKNNGTTNTLPNDPLGGTIGQQQYDQWREHFGDVLPPGSGAALGNAVVPEPAGWLLASLALALAGYGPRRRLAQT